MFGWNRTPAPEAVLQSPTDVGVDMLKEDELVLFDSIVKPAASLFGDACTAAHMEKLWALPRQGIPGDGMVNRNNNSSCKVWILQIIALQKRRNPPA